MMTALFQKRIRRCALALLAATTLCSASVRAEDVSSIRLEVDAREISRKLLHSRETIPVRPGKLVLWYPKWIPGTHAPSGPVQNIGGLRLETAKGDAVAWRRDETEPCRIECTVPNDVDRLIVRIDYICNQSTTESEGVDSFGDTELGVVDWNTCMLYPENASIDEWQATVQLSLPPKWRIGTALSVAEQKDDTIEFKSKTLRDLIDCPLICGEFLRTVELKPKNFPPTFLHLVSESAEAVQLDDKVIEKYRNVASEAGALFGGAHFAEYHFLVTCSDEVGESGVEHLSSSMDGVRERDLIDDKKRKNPWVAELLPHEFVHSWCGKHRRPAGMVTKNFHTPERTSLLWVYEGLTEYLGHLLMVRSGLLSASDFQQELALIVDGLAHTTGRQWRPLEDTAIANYILRAGSPSWGELRRSQDYYNEGELLWLDADAIIRQLSDGHKSLDDFCKKFMGPERKEEIAPYERADVVKALKEVADYDWEKFIHERVDVPQTALPLGVIEDCGYRLEYSTEASQLLKDQESDERFVSAADSLGLDFRDDGEISEVVPGMAGDHAGLAPGMKTIGVNGKKFSADRVRDAIADSVTKRQVELLVQDGDSFRTFTIPYADGLKYLRLVRSSGKPDLLSAILKPVVSEASAGAEKN
jgi:predicted metalloprotease with PDZ domain